MRAQAPTRISVGASAPVFRCFADHFDGRTAAARRAELVIDDRAEGGAGALVVIVPGRAPTSWPLSEIREAPDQAGGDIMVLRHRDDPVLRVVVEDRKAQGIIRARAERLGRRPPVRGKGRLLAWAAAAIASVALIVGVLVPVMADQLARHLPPDGERALGDATLSQIRAALSETGLDPVPACDGPPGIAALGRMEARLLENADLPYPITLHVLDHEMINAFALPGGHVILFRGLIEAAEAPDEVAAVLAHEIGHVAARDPTRMALRSAGSIGVLGLLFGDFAGGAAVLFLVERLIDASYSREAEAAADRYAQDLMIAADLDPQALARMFERFAAQGGEVPGVLEHFMSHPEILGRIEAAREVPAARGAPVLTRSEWGALRGICG